MMTEATVPLCVNCKHYRKDGKHLIDHWCSRGINVVTGEELPIPCHVTRGKEDTVINQFHEDGGIVTDACGHRAKFFEFKVTY
jgi:hypothetical protein